MRDFANKLLRDMAAAQVGTSRFETITCPTCEGTGLFSWTFHGAERQEACRACNGKGVRVVERFT